VGLFPSPSVRHRQATLSFFPPLKGVRPCNSIPGTRYPLYSPLLVGEASECRWFFPFLLGRGDKPASLSPNCGETEGPVEPSAASFFFHRPENAISSELTGSLFPLPQCPFFF